MSDRNWWKVTLTEKSIKPCSKLYAYCREELRQSLLAFQKNFVELGVPVDYKTKGAAYFMNGMPVRLKMYRDSFSIMDWEKEEPRKYSIVTDLDELLERVYPLEGAVAT